MPKKLSKVAMEREAAKRATLVIWNHWAPSRLDTTPEGNTSSDILLLITEIVRDYEKVPRFTSPLGRERQINIWLSNAMDFREKK